MSQSTEEHDPASDIRAWATTVIDAIHAIRGESADLTADQIEHGIRSARSLAIASGAVIDALLITARSNADHRALLTLRQLGDILGHTHGAIDQRVKKITAPDYVLSHEDLWLRR